MRVLVTGSTGQIGGAVAQALMAQGDDVRCLVRSKNNTEALVDCGAELALGDVTVPDSLDAATKECEAVVHAAGLVSYWNPRNEELWRINATGTQNLLEAAKRSGVQRFVLTSSIATLGWVDGDGIGDGSEPYRWHGNGYCDSKKAAEDAVLSESNLEGVAVNPGIVLGAGDARLHGGRMLIDLFNGKMAGVPPGSTTAANLSDVVSGHLAALKRGKVGQRYILGGTAVSFRELFDRICAVIGCAPPQRNVSSSLMWVGAVSQEMQAMFSRREPKLTRALVSLSSKNRMYGSDLAERELGYSPQALEVGIAACWRWYQKAGYMP